ncbi:MAG TPA: M50 family metallopeptidase [Gaiellales bacterium]|nr:M50 family metallopeptidase [Gaiellales bacterium]
MSFFVAVVGLLLLVAIHELGHFSAAKATGMRALRFYLGFPPAILKRTWKGTEYGIGAIPLGGFVKIPGMLRPESGDLYDVEDVLGAARDIDEAAALRLAAGLADVQRSIEQGRFDDAREAGRRLAAEVEATEGLSPVQRRRVLKSLERLDQNLDPAAYWRCPRMRRLIVIAAGPFANVVACFAILTAVALYGLPVAVPVVQSVIAKSPAAATGLRGGDRVVSVNGHHSGVNGIRNAIADSKGGAVKLVVIRDGHRLALRTEKSEVIDGAYRLGFQFGTVNRPYSVVHAPRFAASEMWTLTTGTVRALADVVTPHGRSQLHSTVGIVRVSAQAEQAGATDYLVLLAFISLSLAIFNLLPFLPLDGGHILMIALEQIRGRMVSRAVFERVSVLGIMLMALLFVVGLQNDLSSILNTQPH